MAEILIRGGDAQATADALTAAIRDIFGVEATRTVAGGASAPGTRDLATLALIILALPPAVTGAEDIVARSRLGEKLQRLIGRVASLRRKTHSAVLIDPGDGCHIPLEEASHEAIVAALQRIEQRLRS